jgi:hypothetical protein
LITGLAKRRDFFLAGRRVGAMGKKKIKEKREREIPIAL